MSFAQEVKEGLTASPKRLSSKYFYDEQGSRLFQEIMKLPEYYLTRSEFEVFSTRKTAIGELLANQAGEFDLVELGAGDGTKTRILLREFLDQGLTFSYLPVDISEDALNNLVRALKEELPSLVVEGVAQEYFEGLRQLKLNSQRKKLVLFLGSNIGNFNDQEALKFMRSLRDQLNPGDMLMVGFDLRKDPRLILAAYNDSAGVTREFNLNLLRRINRELGANFDLEKFDHYPVYDPMTGEARSYIVSKEAQEVYIEAINQTISFGLAEPIHTEISRKYTLEQVATLGKEAGFEPLVEYFDGRQYFVDAVWKAI